MSFSFLPARHRLCPNEWTKHAINEVFPAYHAGGHAHFHLQFPCGIRFRQSPPPPPRSPVDYLFLFRFLYDLQALLFYWASTNVFSLAQVGLLRLPAVREFFKIEKINVLTAQVIPTKKMGFVESAKEGDTCCSIHLLSF